MTRNENLEALTEFFPDDTFFDRTLEEDLTPAIFDHMKYMWKKKKVLEKYNFPEKPNSKGIYRIWVPDITAKEGRRQISSKNLEKLKDKVFEYETGRNADGVITFKLAFEKTQEFELDNISEQRKYSKMNTVSKNRSEYKRFFAGTGFELMPIQDITIVDLDAMIRKILKTNRMTKKGLDSIRGIINAVYKRAYFLGWVPENTAGRLVWKDYHRMLYESTPIIERDYSGDELIKFENELVRYHEEHPDYMPAYALEFQIITGMRRGEIPPLTWDDVDFEKGTIHVHREQLTLKNAPGNANKIVEYTKNGKARYYPIADMELEFLERLKAVHDHYYPDSPFLFPGDSENGCISNDTVYQFFHRMCTRLDIPVTRDCMRGTHAFRRNAITEVVNISGGNVVMAAQMFGNSPETIRKHYYTQDNLENKRNVLNLRRKHEYVR